MKCPTCRGKGTQALYGIALTQADREDWSDDELDDYKNGLYDTPCGDCGGDGQVESYQEWADNVHDRSTMRMEMGIYD